MHQSLHDKTGEFRSLLRHPSVMAKHHWHVHVEIVYCAGRKALYDFVSRDVVLDAGDLAIFSAILPHRVCDSERGSVVNVLNVPMEEFLSLQLPRAFVADVLGGKVLVAKAPAHFGRATFAAWHDDLNATDAERVAMAIDEIAVFLKRFAATFQARSVNMVSLTRRDTDLIARILPRVVGIISESGGERLTVKAIARELDLNPKYLTTRFRDLTGVPLGAFILRTRVARARSLLAASDLAMADIAYASGFGSVSQFYAVMKRQTGQTPGQLRGGRPQGRVGLGARETACTAAPTASGCEAAPHSNAGPSE